MPASERQSPEIVFRRVTEERSSHAGHEWEDGTIMTVPRAHGIWPQSFSPPAAPAPHRQARARAHGGYPARQTLITSGTQWGNIAGMNPYVGNYAAGMVGLVNETLLRYDPLKDKYINWLAQSAKWTGAEAVHDRRPVGRQVVRRQAVHRQ